MSDRRNDESVPFCKGGGGICDDCLDSCGRSEYACEVEGHEWVASEDYRTCPRCGETETRSAATNHGSE